MSEKLPTEAMIEAGRDAWCRNPCDANDEAVVRIYLAMQAARPTDAVERAILTFVTNEGEDAGKLPAIQFVVNRADRMAAYIIAALTDTTKDAAHD